MSAKIIACFQAHSPVIITSMIERLRDQSLRSDLPSILSQQSMFTLALADAVARKRRINYGNDGFYLIVMTEADMVTLRMMGYKAIAYADHAEFETLTHLPDEFKDRLRMAAGHREHQQVRGELRRWLIDQMFEIVK